MISDLRKKDIRFLCGLLVVILAIILLVVNIGSNQSVSEHRPTSSDPIVGTWDQNGTTNHRYYFEFYPDGSGIHRDKTGVYNATWSRNEYNSYYTISVDHFHSEDNVSFVTEIKELPDVSRTAYYTCFTADGFVFQKNE